LKAASREKSLRKSLASMQNTYYLKGFLMIFALVATLIMNELDISQIGAEIMQDIIKSENLRVSQDIKFEARSIAAAIGK
jgi:hypothetical protein